jgi:hypothetical protein
MKLLKKLKRFILRLFRKNQSLYFGNMDDFVVLDRDDYFICNNCNRKVNNYYRYEHNCTVIDE